MSTPRVIGISGAPGAGKSTVSTAVSAELASDGVQAAALSLDDFYLTREERDRRGIAWRAVPGSHDIGLIVDTLAAIQDRVEPLVLPRFDASRDDRAPNELLKHTPTVVLFDGWFIGYQGDGYDRLLPYLDWHVHLDIPHDIAKERRFNRESLLRDRTGMGFTEAEMDEFWAEVLEPGMNRWVKVAAEHSDILIEMAPSEYRCLVEPRLDEFLSGRSD